MLGSGQRYAWTVRRPGASEHEGRETLDRLERHAREACARAFPENQGYRHRLVTLGGPLDGFEIRITRGAFRAVISTQSYAQRVSEGVVPEIRLVAVAGSSYGPPPPPRRRSGRNRVRWAMVLAGAGVLGWAVGLGALVPVAAAAYVVPSLAGAFGGFFAGRTLASRELPAAHPPHFEETLPLDLERFSRLGRTLGQLESMAARGLAARPFRALAAGAEDFATTA